MAAEYHCEINVLHSFSTNWIFCIALANLNYERVNIRQLLKWSTGDKPSNAELINVF